MPVCGMIPGSVTWTCDKVCLLHNGDSATLIQVVEYDDCWWKAAVVAVAYVIPSQIQGLFIDSANGNRRYNSTTDVPWATNPVVQLYNPDTGPNLYQPEYYPADIHYRSAVDDKGSQLGVFWPDALTQAMRQSSALHNISGYNHSTGALDGSYPDFGTALSVLTGKAAWVDLFERLADGPDQLWEFIKAKDPSKTPILFNTDFDRKWFNNGTDHQIEPSHAYPITKAYINETTGSKMLETRNVWGRTDSFTMEVVWNAGDCVAHMKDWDQF